MGLGCRRRRGTRRAKSRMRVHMFRVMITVTMKMPEMELGLYGQSRPGDRNSKFILQARHQLRRFRHTAFMPPRTRGLIPVVLSLRVLLKSSSRPCPGQTAPLTPTPIAGPLVHLRRISTTALTISSRSKFWTRLSSMGPQATLLPLNQPSPPSQRHLPRTPWLRHT